MLKRRELLPVSSAGVWVGYMLCCHLDWPDLKVVSKTHVVWVYKRAALSACISDIPKMIWAINGALQTSRTFPARWAFCTSPEGHCYALVFCCGRGHRALVQVAAEPGMPAVHWHTWAHITHNICHRKRGARAMATAVAATNAVIMVSGKSGCPRAWGQACSVASNRVACRHVKEHTVFTCREELESWCKRQCRHSS